MIVWRNFERRSWPSLLICSPKGVPILILGGEGHKNTLDLFLTIAVEFYNKSLNNSDTIPLCLEETKENIEPNKIQSKELICA